MQLCDAFASIYGPFMLITLVALCSNVMLSHDHILLYSMWPWCFRLFVYLLQHYFRNLPEGYLGIPVLCHEMSVQADLLTQPCLKPVHCPIAVAMAKLYSYKSWEVHNWPKQQAPVNMISLFVVWHHWQGQYTWVLSPVFICNALQVCQQRTRWWISLWTYLFSSRPLGKM